MEKDELLAKYSHLHHDSPTEVWIGEFLARSPEFSKDFENLPKYDGTPATGGAWDQFFEKYRIRTLRRNPDTGRLEVQVSSIHSVRLIGIDDPDRDKIYGKFVQDMGAPDFDTPYQVPLMVPDNQDAGKAIANALLGDITIEELSKSSHLLLVAIDLTRRRRDIERHLGQLLDFHKNEEKENRNRARAREWKYYLMVYDLRMERREGRQRTFKEIVAAMTEVAPEAESLESEADALRYFNYAKDLIHGGYKKFIH